MILIAQNALGQSNFRRIENINYKGEKVSHYEYLYPVLDGLARNDSVKINISPEIIDSLKISDSTLINMCNVANNQAKYSLKERTSYQINHSELFYIFIYTKNNQSTIEFQWNFIGENDYGAKKSAVLMSSYDLNGNSIGKNIRSNR